MAILENTIADWYFELGPDIPGVDGPLSLDIFCEWLKKLIHCTNILTNNQIMNPTTIILDNWRQIHQGNIYSSKEISPTNINILNNPYLYELIMEEILKFHKNESIFIPATVKIFGWCKFEEDGNADITVDSTSIEGNNICGGSITVYAIGQKWLPYSLDGKTKHSWYENTATRLEKALFTIENFLNSKALFDGSDYCEINHFRLHNFFDEDTRELIGVNGMGHILPWEPGLLVLPPIPPS